MLYQKKKHVNLVGGRNVILRTTQIRYYVWRREETISKDFCFESNRFLNRNGPVHHKLRQVSVTEITRQSEERFKLVYQLCKETVTQHQNFDVKISCRKVNQTITKSCVDQ